MPANPWRLIARLRSFAPPQVALFHSPPIYIYKYIYIYILAHASEPLEVDRQITILRSPTGCSFSLPPYIHI